MRRVLITASVLCAVGAAVVGAVTLSGGFKDVFWRPATAQWVQEPVYVAGVSLTVGLLCAALLLAGMASALGRLEEMAQARRPYGPGTRALHRETPATTAPPPPAAEIPDAARHAPADLNVMAVQRAR